MPSLQQVDTSPIARTRSTPLEDAAGSFANRFRENQINAQDTDSLRRIYEQHQNDGDNIGNIIKSVQTNSQMSPTAKVKNIDQLLKFQEHNSKMQKTAQMQMTQKQKEEKAAREQQEKDEKKEAKVKVTEDLEDKRGLPRGSLKAYADADDTRLAEMTTRPEKATKRTEASQPIHPDQLAIIKDVRSQPGYKDLSPSEKYQALTDAGVSVRNAEAEAKVAAESDKLRNERSSVINKGQAKEDMDFYNDQIKNIPRMEKLQQTITDAEKLNEQGVTGRPWDQMMQKLGLLQYTSDGFRLYSSYAKEMVKNQNIRDIIGSQISQLEFGFFRDATISERFSQEANNQILKKEKAALRLEKLYGEITAKMVEDNNGQIPERFQQKVNAEFAKQAPKINKDIIEASKDFDMIQEVPNGFVLMYDKKRRPLHVPANKVKLAEQKGASLR